MIKAIVIGASFGGIEAIREVLLHLPASVRVPIFIVLHIGNNRIDGFINSLNNNLKYTVQEAMDKDSIETGHIYFAPPNYHLQIEDNGTMSLSVDLKVNFSRPSIDVLFETAAWAFKDELMGILLTGSNADGANGMMTIKQCGGTTIVEDPRTATSGIMPMAAIELAPPDEILSVKDIAAKIAAIVGS